MRYVFALIMEEGGMDDASPEELKAGLERWSAYGQELTEAGAFISGEGLTPSAAATTIRIAPDGERTTTDGPFAETKEQLAGFYLVECDDLDEALEWANKVPLPAGAIEVRPVMDYEAAGYESAETAEVAS